MVIYDYGWGHKLQIVISFLLLLVTLIKLQNETRSIEGYLETH